MADSNSSSITLSLQQIIVFLIAVLGFIGASFVTGLGFGQHASKENITYLENKIKDNDIKISKSENERDQFRKRAEILKKRVDEYEEEAQRRLMTSAGSVSKGSSNGTVPSASSTIPKKGTIELQVLVGETAEILAGQIFISVVSIKPMPTPPSYQVSTNLGAPGKETLLLEGPVGTSTTFGGFEIRIVEIDAASAKFLIRMLSAPAPSQP